MIVDEVSKDPSLNRRDLVTVLVVVVAAIIIRSIALGSESFWIDEVMTARRSGWGFMEVMRSIGERDHLPLYYILMMGWAKLFGTSEIGLRSFSVLAGGLSIIPIYLMGRRNSFRMGIFAGSIACVLPVHVYFGQEAKMYALIILLTSLSLFAMVEYIDPRIITSKKISASILIATNILLAYVHYYSYLFIIGELVFISYIIIKNGQGKWWKQIIKGTWPAYIPLLSGSIWFMFLVSEGFLFSQETGGGISLSPISILSIYPFIAGAYVVPDEIEYIPMMLASLTLLICMVWGSISRRNERVDHENWNRVLALIFLISLPLASLVLSLTIMNIFGPRYFLFLAPVVLLLSVTSLKSLKQIKIRNTLLVSVIILSILALPVQYLKVEKDDWRSTISYLDHNLQENDVVIPVPSWEYRSIDYYNSELTVVYASNPTDLDDKLSDTDRVWVIVKGIKDDGWTLDHLEDIFGAPSIEKEFHGLSLYLFER